MQEVTAWFSMRLRMKQIGFMRRVLFMRADSLIWKLIDWHEQVYRVVLDVRFGSYSLLTVYVFLTMS